jgi:hypothetical protein
VPSSTPTITKTITQTSTALPTGTATATVTVIPDSEFRILNLEVYPNPYRPRAGDLTFSFDATMPADKITVRIYTVSYRRIIEVTEYGSFYGRSTVSIASRKLQKLANGTYYIVIVGEGSGSKTISKPVELIVLN